ncbi:hypothetical protein [Paludisphaera rhizosphaerae]|uniref:hypothetical protein n=1 Tax=Paludisphaera rhizosphaerae TaxID=2711216 RepID=UPI00197F7CDE|nr:hypothetical protein [Paludisphaera rhizosphaerae]
MANSYLGLDTTTQGAWSTKYDGGFVPPSVDPAAGTSPPAYVTSYANTDSAAEYAFYPEDDRAAALTRPGGGHGYLVGWYSASSFRFEFTVTSACRFGFYIWDSDSNRQASASLLASDGETILGSGPTPVGGPYEITNYADGLWLEWELDPGTYYAQIVRTAGANAVVNGLFWGAIPGSAVEVDGPGGVSVGGPSDYSSSSSQVAVGGVELGGVSAIASSTSVVAVGGVELGGVSSYATASPSTAVALGGVTVGGVSTYSTSTSVVAVGGVTVGGPSDYSQPPAPGSVVAAGGVAIGGVSTYTSSTSIVAAGGVTVGEAEPEPILPPCSPMALAAAIRDALDATGAFDAVWQAGDSDDRGEPGRLAAIAVERGPVVSEALCDTGPDSLVIHTARHSLRIVVRRDDPLERDDEADRLQAVAANALNGRKWFANDWPDWARVLEWKRLPAVDAERQVLATFQSRWHEEGWRVAPDS